MTDHVIVTDDGPIRILRLNRPDKRNALTDAMYEMLSEALENAAVSKNVRCVVITGGPDAFTAGADLHDFLHAAQRMEGARPQTMRFLHRIAHAGKPLVAAVEGVAIGIGTTMLLHCDYVVATSAATFATPFTKLGLIPEAASSLLGPMRMGHARAFALLVMGRTMSAEEAKAAGLINAIVDSAALDSAVLQAAREVAGLPAGAVALARKLMRGNLDDLLRRVDTEAMYFKERLQSDEARAAFAAFLARKK
jgi:enoyl-CoA hydratase/carnithine racemase